MQYQEYRRSIPASTGIEGLKTYQNTKGIFIKCLIFILRDHLWFMISSKIIIICGHNHRQHAYKKGSDHTQSLPFLYISGLNIRRMHSHPRSASDRFWQYFSVTSRQTGKSVSKSCRTANTALHFANQHAFSKCRYRLRKSILIVPTTATSSSQTICLE